MVNTIKKVFSSKKTLLVVLGGAVLGLGAWAYTGKWWKPSTPPLTIDGRAEWAKLVQQYQHPYQYIEGSIRIYDDESQSQEKERMVFTFQKDGDNYYSQLGSTCTIKSGDLLVQMDDEQKEILVNRINGTENAPAASALGFDQIVKDTNAFRITGNVVVSGINRIIAISSDYSPEVRSARFTYDTVSYRINSAVIEWYRQMDVPEDNTVYYMRIDYAYPATTSVSVADRLNAIITKREDKLVPAEKYGAYQFEFAN